MCSQLFLFFTSYFHPRFIKLAYVHFKLAHVKCPNYSTYFRLFESTCFFQTSCLVKCRPCKRNLRDFVELVLQGVEELKSKKGLNVEHVLQELELTCNDGEHVELK